jgi:hypothetical protein
MALHQAQRNHRLDRVLDKGMVLHQGRHSHQLEWDRVLALHQDQQSQPEALTSPKEVAKAPGMAPGCW